MRQTEATCSSADLAELIETMQRLLARLDECTLSLPASYVQHALEHVLQVAGT